ncbi:two-partner secretion domain-containing protein [Candidatus Venteria ishoeyi]|uniref:Haemagglutination activity domain protein n=1 Tax=Candidatus Venteria ishoeyi TaxID=1899563 RepID=A0A1H6FHI5_9GAMM|nr:filamentous hemagglutinin N-terminal domain-containing protein [Candidatus Venteria ishoeyi]MDM8547409.1 filamentous hemagglutinin N-terminal domain-containing protein [Candidatus Venteria ishoeyi]SEH08819.1 haemagglutination activity domain protein [Candidatus Venteria ishoeyi]
MLINKNNTGKIWFFGGLYLFFSPVAAEITVDSSFFQQPQLLTPNQGEYAITQNLGKVIGNNLFHSFQDFNLKQGETARFSGAAHINNVISRVTGGSPSHINGTISNTIPGANTYLLNPAGIFFAEHARLDVSGGFYATTADYLNL